MATNRTISMMYAGAVDGIYRSQDTGATWERLESPMNDIPIWSLTIDPVDSNIIFAGTRPALLFRSKDGGQTWKNLTVEMAEECPPREDSQGNGPGGCPGGP